MLQVDEIAEFTNLVWGECNNKKYDNFTMENIKLANLSIKLEAFAPLEFIGNMGHKIAKIQPMHPAGSRAMCSNMQIFFLSFT